MLKVETKFAFYILSMYCKRKMFQFNLKKYSVSVLPTLCTWLTVYLLYLHSSILNEINLRRDCKILLKGKEWNWNV